MSTVQPFHIDDALKLKSKQKNLLFQEIINGVNKAIEWAIQHLQDFAEYEFDDDEIKYADEIESMYRENGFMVDRLGEDDDRLRIAGWQDIPPRKIPRPEKICDVENKD